MSRGAVRCASTPAPRRLTQRLLAGLAWLVLAASCACQNARAEATATQSGTVAGHFIHSTAMGRDWRYLVYLPADYEATGGPYPVLYLLHGNNGDAADWFSAGRLQASVERLIASGAVPPVVIVLPQGGTDWYVDRKEQIETAFFNELVPEVERRFHAGGQRRLRAIGGVSMGGFGALRYAMGHPDMFCSAMLLSPAIYSLEPPATSAARYVGVFGEPAYDPTVWRRLNYPAHWEMFLSRARKVPMFIASGDDDLTIQAEASLLYTRLRRAEQPAALRIIGGGHTWEVWRALLEEGLRYTLACVRPQAGSPGHGAGAAVSAPVANPAVAAVPAIAATASAAPTSAVVPAASSPSMPSGPAATKGVTHEAPGSPPAALPLPSYRARP